MTPYPDQTRYIARAAAALGYRFTDLDSGGGYLYAVSDGVREFVGGGAPVCAYPLNSAMAFGISRDKHHTNAALARAGLPVIPGRLFFLTDEFVKLRTPGREIPDAIAAFAQMPKPVFCKPNQGSRGNFAEIVRDEVGFHAYIERVRARHDAILLQPLLSGDEYRVFCIDESAIFSTRKSAFRLTGDGRKTLGQLLHDHNATLKGTGISAVDMAGVFADHARDRILADKETLVLPGRRNLSAGGDVESFTTDVPGALSLLALSAAKAIGLRVAGIDIFDISAAHDLSSLVIIEVNGNPGITTLEAIGRDDLIDEIWRTILTRAFAEMRT
jgi:glutathione synthase/RimK-type ligase-like ATP-grasp enzyme